MNFQCVRVSKQISNANKYLIRAYFIFGLLNFNVILLFLPLHPLCTVIALFSRMDWNSIDATPRQRNALHSRNVTGTQFSARFAAAATHTALILSQTGCIFSLVNTKAYLLFLAQVACIKFDKFQSQSPAGAGAEAADSSSVTDVKSNKECGWMWVCMRVCVHVCVLRYQHANAVKS